MLGKSKTKNNFGLISTLKDKKYQYISRSTNKKITKNDNINNNKNNKDNFKVTSNLIDINKYQNSNDKYKKYVPEFSQNHSLLNFISKNQQPNINNNKNSNYNIISNPKNKIFLVENNSSNNSSLFFNMNEEMKINNNNNIISLNKQKNKNIYQGNIGLENINNLNMQKYNIKKNYEKYINSNNNSLEENLIKNNNNSRLILDSNVSNKNMPLHKNKNIDNNNKYIIQKILTNLFSSNKKKPYNNNIKKSNINNHGENKYFINDSFNNNKIMNYNQKKFNNNYFNKEKKYTEKNRETPRLKSSNNNNKKKISGLFSANPKEKGSNLITEINNPKANKINENLTKRNLSINIHSYKVNDYKFKTSIDLDSNNKNNELDEKNVPKLNLNQVFNLKLYDKNKPNNNKSNKQNNFISLNNISLENQKKEKVININIISNPKNKKLFYVNNKNNGKDNPKNQSNTFIINTRIEENNLNNKNNNENRTKFSPKNIYLKGIKKSNIQRFFSYSKNKKNMKSNIHFMNNIKKINFNDTKKSGSKNITRRDIISNDSRKMSNNKISEVKIIDNKRLNSNKYIKVSNSDKKYKQKEIVEDSRIKLRKRKPKYSDINRIIEINNLKCMKYINNSEINNLKKININFSTNEANENKRNNYNNINLHKRSNYSASHNSINNNDGKYIISKIGSIFKPKVENNIRNSYNNPNNKNKINYNLLSLIDNKSKEKNNQDKNVKPKNKFLGIYESNKKINEFNKKMSLELDKINMKVAENKTKENILQNSLTMYSIYIISKYYNTCDKIGIAKISLFDKDKKIIPIEYSITNEGININYLFNNNLELSFQADIFNDSGMIPYISNYEPNLCINFYVKNIYITKLEYIEINNFSDINNGISPAKEVKIFQTDILLFKGILELKNTNIIKINNLVNEDENNQIRIDELDKRKNIELLGDNKKSLTYTIFKSLINENSDYSENTFKLNRYNSARNTFNENHVKSSDNNSNNNFNNIDNIDNKLNIKSKSFVQNLDFFYNKENENTENIIKTNQESNNHINKLIDGSNTNISNLNLYTNELMDNEKDINFSQTLKIPNNTSKLFLNSYNSAYNDCDNLFRTSVGYGGLQEIPNFSVISTQSPKTFLELNKISIYLKSNYGHKKYIGLTGCVFLDQNNEPIDIEKAKAIGALPKDLRTIYNDDSDNRIFENLFNCVNNTNDSDNMWVTRIKKNDIPYFELFFEEKIKLSKILIYNYNQRNHLEIGTKEIDIYIDNFFYNKFNLIQGTGEIAYIDNNINDISINNFGQEIFFNNENIFNRSNINESENNISKEVNIDELMGIKFASDIFEQCYETPFMPCGNVIKIQFMSYYNDINNNETKDSNINEFFLGLENIEIYNEEGVNILNREHNVKENKEKKEDKNILKYKMVSNRKMKHNDKNDILLQIVYNEDENGNNLYDDENYLFYIFEKYIQIGYIKFFPLENSELIENNEQNIFFKTKEIKIFCDDKLIYEGFIYDDKPTIILFASDEKLTKNINEDYLTKNFNKRKTEEIVTNSYNCLILN